MKSKALWAGLLALAAADWLVINLAVGPAYLASQDAAAPAEAGVVAAASAMPSVPPPAPTEAVAALAAPARAEPPVAPLPAPEPEPPAPAEAEPPSAEEQVFFTRQSAELREDARTTLETVALDLTRNPDARVVIEGHADRRGSAELNEWLSMQRARSVRAYLHSLGVRPSQMEVTAHGSTRPLDTSGTDAARAKNRRVQLTIK